MDKQETVDEINKLMTEIVGGWRRALDRADEIAEEYDAERRARYAQMTGRQS